MEYNVYCDESCHVEHDKHKFMVIGAVYCPKDQTLQINERLKQIKKDGKFSVLQEIKWSKVSSSNFGVVKDMVYKFFDDDDMFFRAIIIDKSKLDFEKHSSQNFKSFYYVAYYEMLKVIFAPTCSYNIYLDIKDTNSQTRIDTLKECLDIYINKTFRKKLIKKVQHIRSHEVQIMQLTDLLIGAIAYEYNQNKKNVDSKKRIIDIIQKASGYDFTQTTLLREEKFNLLVWEFTKEKNSGFKYLQ